MTKRTTSLAALIIGLILLVQLILVTGCLVERSEYSSLIAQTDEVVAARIKWLDEQKFQGPEVPASLEINVDSVESSTHRTTKDGGGGGG
jgi:inner membrane protein involved in colicin E2 resistance